MHETIAAPHEDERTGSPPLTGDALVRQLRWRYAVKKFDASRKISPADWEALEEALVLTPSSFGLQPWRFFVVTDQEVKDRLVAASWNQRQVADASHVVVFAVRRNLNVADIDRFVARMAEVRGVAPASLAAYRAMMVDSLSPRDGFDVHEWSARQTYIALGNFMTAAAMLGIDTCPMEGIVPAQYDEIIGLADGDYGALVVAAAGYRAVDDSYAKAPKVRFAASEVIVQVA